MAGGREEELPGAEPGSGSGRAPAGGARRVVGAVGPGGAGPGADGLRVGPELAPDALAAARVGLFGGSFDPVHRGHLTVVRAALGRAGLDHLVVVPARVSPHKLDRAPAPGPERVELLRAALSTLPPELRARLSIWTAELGRDGPSFTFDTVRELERLRGRREELPRLVLGQDSLDGLPRWHERDALLGRVRLVVVERGGGEPLEAVLERLRDALPEPALAAVRDGWVALAEPSAASSTALRAGLARGEGDLGELPEEVAERIRRAGLYRADEPPGGGEG
jgi:nicotinate-nucleotide adenylyltransferase